MAQGTNLQKVLEEFEKSADRGDPEQIKVG